jgi:L-lactate dehydrogenase complex protein LldF
MPRHACRAFQSNVSAALGNEKQRAAIRSSTERLLSKRAAALPDPETFLPLREKARAIRLQSLQDLPRILQRFENSVKSLGGKVHRAGDAAEANDIIRRIALERRVRRIVKSKSMVSEEIGLNDALEAKGLKVVETDLGEYIIQLAGETPFHIVAPALHWTRDDVSRLFAEKLGAPPTREIEKLTRVAREALRNEFRSADMGITGANMAAADTGTIVIVENEGNVRMTSALPPIHVVLLGIEKVIARFVDTAAVLRILTRSATGQKITSYVSFLTGPAAHNGPGKALSPELHVVLLDNGRSQILANPALREALLCIRCGACLNTCPVYQSIGGHAYGWVYPGPIGSILTPLTLGLAEAPDLPFASSLCAACSEICPVGIDLPRLLLELRSMIAEGTSSTARQSSRLEKLLFQFWGFWMEGIKRYRFAARIAYWLEVPFRRKGRVPRLPYPLSAWTRTKDFPVASRKTFHRIWKEREKEREKNERN